MIKRKNFRGNTLKQQPRLLTDLKNISPMPITTVRDLAIDTTTGLGCYYQDLSHPLLASKFGNGSNWLNLLYNACF